MPRPDDITDQQKLLANYRRRLNDQLIQLAQVGAAHAQPALLTDIREAREQIARIKATLRSWNIAVETLPNDIDPDRHLRIFISYKHDTAQSEALAKEIAAALRESYDVFIDSEMTIGVRWAEQIEVELARADFLIALISAQATESEMVRGEIAFAHTLNKAQQHPQILPVRVAYRAPFPYPLNEYLDSLQWAFWNDDSDTPALIQSLHKALLGAALPFANDEQKRSVLEYNPIPAAPPAMAALPNASRSTLDLEPPEGSMAADSQFYIPRASDALALAAIRNSRGATLTIKGPRQMGKSSLLLRVLDVAAQLGKQIALLDFQFFEQKVLHNPDIFFRQFCASLSDALDLEDHTEEYWHAQLGNSQRCTRYVERYLLRNINAPLVLAMDEVESMFDADFRSDFFSMLRGWHNNRASRPIWRRLDLALVTSTEPYQLIANLNQSPFNVGQIVTLEDFSDEELTELNKKHGSPLDSSGLKLLIQLLAGHPYLTRRALYLLASGHSNATTLFAEAAHERGPFGDHLRYHLFRLQGQTELIGGFLQVLQKNKCEDEAIFWRLHGAGLVRGDTSQARARNQLYASFFGAHLKR